MAVETRAPQGKNVLPAAPRMRRRMLRRIILPVALVVFVALTLIGVSLYRDAQLYVATDNAQITGQPVQVGSMNTGRVSAVSVKVGERVHSGDVVAQVALPSQIGVAQNGQPKLDFLGGADTHVNVLSPIDGVVMATPVAVGASVQAGESIVEVFDPTQLWVTANVDETSVSRVHTGESVSVHVDALNADFPGVVDSVTPATAATFSLLPSNNTSGNFNRVVQLIPVQIRVGLANEPTLLGTSAEVRIRVAD